MTSTVPDPPTAAQFIFGDMFPADDLLSEWLATISMAANDLILTHVLIESTDDDSVRWYCHLAAIGHFYEVAKHLEETAALPEVKVFVASLDRRAALAYEKVIDTFNSNRVLISKVRNLRFHYPSMMNPKKPGQLKTKRALPAILRSSARVATTARLGRLRHARLEYASELNARLVARSLGGESGYYRLRDEVRAGTEAFIRFMNPALDTHFERRHQAGGQIRFK